MVETNLDIKKEARAIVRYLRISPRKVRPVLQTIRRQPVSKALSVLAFLNKKAARFVEKGLKSAVANAKGKGLEEGRLVVFEAKADGGPMLKRFMTRSMGRSDQILKRTTHLTLVLREGGRTVGGMPPGAGEEKQAKKAKPAKGRFLKAASRGKLKTKEKALAAK